MITKQEYLLSVPFDFIIGFSKETGLIRSNRYFTKKDFVHRLVASLEISECRQIYEDHRSGQSYKKSVDWFLTKFPTGQSLSKSFVESQDSQRQCNFYFEFPVSQTRVDILNLTSGFHAYEVKSTRDSFGRLAYQIPALKRFFEHVSLIIPANVCQDALRSIDDNIGIIYFSTENEKISFQEIRIADYLDEYEPHAQLSILQTSELRKMCCHFDSKTKELNRNSLIKSLEDRLSRSQINETFKQAIRKRQRVSSQQFLPEIA